MTVYRLSKTCNYPGAGRAWAAIDRDTLEAVEIMAMGSMPIPEPIEKPDRRCRTGKRVDRKATARNERAMFGEFRNRKRSELAAKYPNCEIVGGTASCREFYDY